MASDASESQRPSHGQRRTLSMFPPLTRTGSNKSVLELVEQSASYSEASVSASTAAVTSPSCTLHSRGASAPPCVDDLSHDAPLSPEQRVKQNLARLKVQVEESKPRMNRKRQIQLDDSGGAVCMGTLVPTPGSTDPMRLLHARSQSLRSLKLPKLAADSTLPGVDEESTVPPSVDQTPRHNPSSPQDAMHTHIQMGQHEYEIWSDLSLWKTTWKIVLSKINAEDGWCLYFLLFVARVNSIQTLIGLAFTVLVFVLNRRQYLGYILDVGGMDHGTMYLIWLVFSIVSVSVFALVILVHRFQVSRMMDAWRNGDNISIEDPWKGQIGPGTLGKESVDQILYPFGYPSLKRVRQGRILSAILFCIGLGLNVLFNYYLTVATLSSPNAVAASILSMILVLFTFIWQVVCIMSSRLECHRYDSIKKKSDFLKIFLFKSVTGLTMLAVKNAAALEDPTRRKGCSLSSIGDDLLILILIDGLSECILKIAGNKFQRWIFTKLGSLFKITFERFGLSNEEFMPIFEASDEYVAVLTRQPLVMLASVSKPLLAPLVAAIISTGVYWMNKYKILRVARPAVRTNNTYKYMLPSLWIANSIAAILVFPMGALWLLSGRVPEADSCRIY